MLLNPAKEQQSLYITKDSEVEVSSEDEGFKGAWYRAILEESPTKSGRKKLRVRYTTLINDDCSTLLTETVEQSFIRPIPPEENSDFEEGSVVDADLKDGWWNGVVIKKMENEKFLVYFDSPPDVIQFEKKQLRTHLDWIDSKWIRPENKVLSKSLFSCGTMVEVNCKIDKSETIWVPAIVVKEIEVENQKKLIVKCCDKSLSLNNVGDEVKPNIIVDLRSVRPIPPPLFVDEYLLLDRVEAFRGSGWCKALVRGILSDKRYRVSFLASKEESVVKHSDLRPSKEWEDGVWHQEETKQKAEKETSSDGKRKNSVALETTLSELTAMCRPKKLKITRPSTATKPMTTEKSSPKPAEKIIEKTVESETKLGENVDTMGTPLARDSGNVIADSTMNGETMQVMTPEATPLEESASPATADINATPETQGKISPEPMKKRNGLRIKLTEEKIPEEHNNNDKNRKRRKEQELDLNLNETACNVSKEGQITNTSDDEYDQSLASWIQSSAGFDKSKLSSDQTRANKDITGLVMPFSKHSPIWKNIESLEVLKSVPQSPHFSPLLETWEEFREGSAMGKIVSFSTLLEKVHNLKLNVSKNELKRLKDCFYELEKYGFDIKAPISRIDMISSLKDKRASTVKAQKEKEKEIMEEVSKKQKVEEDLRDVEIKILKLRDQESELKTRKEVSENTIAEMKLCVSDLDKKIEDVEVEFEKIVQAPW